MGENLQQAPSTKQGNSTASLFGKVKTETIKESTEIIKEVVTEVASKVDLKEHEKPSITDLATKKIKEASAEIDVADVLKPKDEDTKIKITFKKKGFIKKEVSKKTADAPIEDVSSNSSKPMIGDNSPTSEELREQIKAAENTTRESFTPGDYEMIAEFLIDTVDWGGSSLLMWIAKDKTDTPYTLAATKKERLKKQLTRILIKSNVKMNFTVLFIISLVLAYMKPVTEAIKTRQSIKKGEDELKRKRAKEIKEERERVRIKALEIPIEVKPVVQQKKRVVVTSETIKDEVTEAIITKDDVEKVIVGTEEIKNDELKDDNKPTEDTKIDKRGEVIIDRPQGNPKGRRARKRNK